MMARSITAIAAIILVAWPGVGLAHLSGLCTSTDPNDPGQIVFYVATYHSIGGASVPGEVHVHIHIQSPSGSVSSFAFTTLRAATPARSNMTGAQWTSNVNTSFGLPSTTEVSCFGDRPAGAASTPPMLDTAENNGCATTKARGERRANRRLKIPSRRSGQCLSY